MIRKDLYGASQVLLLKQVPVETEAKQPVKWGLWWQSCCLNKFVILSIMYAWKMLDNYCDVLFSYACSSQSVCDQIAVLYAIHHVCPVSQQTVDCQVTMQDFLPTFVLVLWTAAKCRPQRNQHLQYSWQHTWGCQGSCCWCTRNCSFSQRNCWFWLFQSS